MYRYLVFANTFHLNMGDFRISEIRIDHRRRPQIGLFEIGPIENCSTQIPCQ